jgi:hypothetical protein
MHEVTDDVTSYATGEWGMEMFTGDHRNPSHDEIARLAFDFYEARGRQEGHAIEDWLRAEQELTRHYA